MLILSIVSTAVIALAMRAFTDTATITNRRDVYADGRLALDRMSKQFRQGEAVDQAASSTSQATVSTYLDGAAATVVWRVDGSSPPYRLQESRDGGTTYTTVVSSLSSPDVFTYTAHDGVVDQITISLSLATNTSTVDLTSDINLRNAA